MLNKEQLNIAKEIFNFKPYPYQEELFLSDKEINIFCVGRRGGKSDGGSFKLAASIFFNSSGGKYGTYNALVATPVLEQSRIIYDATRNHFARSPSSSIRNMIKCKETPHPTIISGKSIVKFQSLGEDRGRSLEGFKYLDMYIDECTFVPEDVFWNSLYPMTADYPDSQIHLLGKAFGGRGSWVKRLATSKKPNVRAWNISTLQCPNETIRSWAVRARDTMPLKSYRQEILCEWVEDDNAFFTFDSVMQLHDSRYILPQHPRPNHFYRIGVDIADSEDYTAIVVIDEIRSPICVVDVQRINEVGYRNIANAITDQIAKYRPRHCKIDATGLGGPICTMVQESVDSLNLKTVIHSVVLTGKMKEECLQNLATLIDTRRIVIPRQFDVLYDELLNYEYKISPRTQKMTLGAPRGSHDDTVIALSLAVHGSIPGKEQTPDEYPQVGTQRWWKELQAGYKRFAKSRNYAPIRRIR